MIQLQILSGKSAGSEVIVRHFPFLIGRGAGAGLRLEEPGVWERHLELQFCDGEGFVFSSQNAALTLVNGVAVETGILRNGDVIEAGSVRLRFWLARSEQKSLRMREWLTWASLFFLSAIQIVLIIRLLR